MAEPLPAALKIPEVSRFINRANQLRSFKPAISYWCEYHAVNQIVAKSLHTTDDECFNFTKTLIERLETTKAERADDDAIIDNTAGQAYVEQFAQETFDRAERTMRANKVTRQTADTFDAAATFFDLTHEWGTPEADTLQKIKFAKWNAARILKAIREGNDPNDSNPQLKEAEAESMALDLNDPDVQRLGLLSQSPQPAYVEEIPDGGEPPRSLPQAHEEYFPNDHLEPPPEPFVPSPLSQSPDLLVPSMPPPSTQYHETPSPSIQVPSQPSPQIPAGLPAQFGALSPELNSASPPPWTTASNLPPQGGTSSPLTTTPAPSVLRYPAAASSPAATPSQSTTGVGYTTDQKDINQAQKHAKWAISALNFEDIPTAVKELQNALASLGAR